MTRPFPLKEWTLQATLTGLWASRGVMVAGERLYLAAWEVMTDWRVNDASRHWNRPSIDFVCLDSMGRLALIELKIRVDTPQQAWLALCQVTHRAVELGRTYTPAALDDVHRSCRSGYHGRMREQGAEPVEIGHARFFELDDPVILPGRPVRRIVAAVTFGAAWTKVWGEFTRRHSAVVADDLQRRYRVDAPANRELARFLALEVAQDDLLGPVTPLRVDESWPGVREQCPVCGLRSGVAIAYGFPGPEMIEAADRGEIMLGGCVVDLEQSVWGCRLCRHKWSPG